MTRKEDSSSTSVTTEPKHLHPVYSVTNIHNKIRTLDGEKVTYSAWVKLFRLHAKGYEVLKHIDGTEPPAKDDEGYDSWAKVDSIVLQWIYGTISDDLLVRILDDHTTAQQAWNKLQSIFQNNKNSRASSLLHAFTNTTLASCAPLKEYFHKLKDMSEQLKDGDQPVTESRLVLQMVQGLPPEYDTTASFINQSSNISWDDARDMIEREQRRQAARQQTALMAPRGPSTFAGSQPNQTPPQQPFTPSYQTPPPPSYNPAQQYEQYHRGGRGRGRGRNTYRGGRGRGHNNSYNYTPTGYQSPPPTGTYGWWNSPPPPCPYPSQSPWTTYWSRPPPQTSNPPAPQPNQPNTPYGPPPGYGLTAQPAQQPPAA
ncbi:uncharacterized protein LOC110893081 [Helianthus annuus]|uniref:uncharacterized protein LOC110893081 n=1 Tax=Helianthus annuus TaxID=4232 RepID=UPI000B904EB4|nr:uncharacterized protein LOC110893081 [Helianthus annuus]